MGALVWCFGLKTALPRPFALPNPTPGSPPDSVMTRQTKPARSGDGAGRTNTRDYVDDGKWRR